VILGQIVNLKDLGESESAANG